MEDTTERDMSYRRTTSGTIWHWCHNCSGWPSSDFRRREDKPSTWGGHSLCDECDTRARSGNGQHSIELRTGLASDRVLGPILY
jgi:hypothetical protein